MAMTKAEIVECIYEKVEKDGFSKKDAAEVVESIFEVIKKHLEHGEKVECIECIPTVSQLLYNSNARNREISAWWLRRWPCTRREVRTCGTAMKSSSMMTAGRQRRGGNHCFNWAKG